MMFSVEFSIYSLFLYYIIIIIIILSITVNGNIILFTTLILNYSFHAMDRNVFIC